MYELNFTFERIKKNSAPLDYKHILKGKEDEFWGEMLYSPTFTNINYDNWNRGVDTATRQIQANEDRYFVNQINGQWYENERARPSWATPTWVDYEQARRGAIIRDEEARRVAQQNLWYIDLNTSTTPFQINNGTTYFMGTTTV